MVIEMSGVGELASEYCVQDRPRRDLQLGHALRPEAIRRHWDIGVEVGVTSDG